MPLFDLERHAVVRRRNKKVNHLLLLLLLACAVIKQLNYKISTWKLQHLLLLLLLVNSITTSLSSSASSLCPLLTGSYVQPTNKSQKSLKFVPCGSGGISFPIDSFLPSPIHHVVCVHVDLNTFHYETFICSWERDSSTIGERRERESQRLEWNDMQIRGIVSIDQDFPAADETPSKSVFWEGGKKERMKERTNLIVRHLLYI